MNTQIICTIGPSCNTFGSLEGLVNSGMNIARLNLSHGNMESHYNAIFLLQQLNTEKQANVKIMVDTKGPELRIKQFENGFAMLEDNQTFTLTTTEVVGNHSRVTLAQPYIVSEIQIGDIIYANNGMLQLEVKQKTETDLVCTVLFGGILSNNKGINIPNVSPTGPYLSQKDKNDLLLAINNQVDYVAASFVSNAKCIAELKEYLAINNRPELKIIAKIENAEGVRNIKSIVNAADGIMVARGDLGVEIPQEQVPHVQKAIAALCFESNKFCIVATEMLESMTFNIRPTRAEVSDVANAVYDRASAVMLSGETAIGKHPALVAQMMKKIVQEAEKHIK